MPFCSVFFLFYFLPAVLLGHFLLPRPLRNGWLLLASLFFYAWGEVQYTLIMLISIVVNYVFGLVIGESKRPQARRIGLIIAIAVNLSMLGMFKYANFIVDNIDAVLMWFGIIPIRLEPVHLPIGISFFTFQAMSYVIDVYRGQAPVQRNPFRVALYIALFPQLIAGPIVRYLDIAGQLAQRTITRAGFAYGVRRFMIGFGKKILVADVLARVAGQVYAMAPHEFSVPLAWLGVYGYLLHIYFDFSGYSDMAIGLGHMFGFRIRENFNYPFIAQSVREFWRRWHISLSTWFRDYLYIPLGGSQRSKLRTAFNLIITLMLCGLWHDGSWTYITCFLMFGIIVAFERTPPGRWLERAWRPLRHLYAILAVGSASAFFRMGAMEQSWTLLKAMWGFTAAGASPRPLAYVVDNEVLLVLALAIIGSTPIWPNVSAWIKRRFDGGEAFLAVAAPVACVAVFLLACMSLAANTHTPFIYFRF